MGRCENIAAICVMSPDRGSTACATSSEQYARKTAPPSPLALLAPTQWPQANGGATLGLHAPLAQQHERNPADTPRLCEANRGGV